MSLDAKELRERGDQLFAKKQPFDRRNQDIAGHFYPERADFTMDLAELELFADHLTTSYPLLIRRDLGNAIGSILRPRTKKWFFIRTSNWDRVDYEGRLWAESRNEIMRRAMYDRSANLLRATTEGDNDWATFGGCVISVEMNQRDVSLLFRNWHLRDVAWAEDCYGAIGEIHRNWKPTCAHLAKLFPGRVSKQCADRIAAQRGHETIHVRHAVVRADEYHKPFKQPWVSVYYDCESDHVIEEKGSWTPIYVIPRWATVSGSQYPYSPATLIALPEARLLQAQALTLLEAGEKAVNPPMIGVGEAIPGGPNIYAGGFTSVDAAYDERLGEVLRPLTQDNRALPFGIDMADRTAGLLREAFFLNTLSMPPHDGPEMTAFEVGQRVQEYIRNALPLFEPMEHEYNGALCEVTFETLLRNGAFGPPAAVPQSIRGEEVQFVFDNPLSEMVEREKGQKFLEAQAMVAAAAQVDPESLRQLNFGVALQDSLLGIGVPTKWLRPPEEIAREKAEAAQAAQIQQALAGMQMGADVAATLGDASKSFAQAQPAAAV